MTAQALATAEVAPARTMPEVLAHTHLRLGLLALARTELETLAELGRLEAAGLVDLAEVRWRTGDLVGAGEAAALALRGDKSFPIALLIAAEAAAALGRPSEARRLAAQVGEAATSIDVLFAGMPRSPAWPPDADEPPPTAPTLFDRAPEPPPRGDAGRPADAPIPAAATPPLPAAGPMTLGLWGEEVEEPGSRDLPDPALEFEAGRAALVAGALDQAALHFAMALRVAPALAPAVLEVTAGARAPGLAIVRGDAYRLAGHEAEARESYLVAAQGGLPERRRRARLKADKVAQGDKRDKAAKGRRGSRDAEAAPGDGGADLEAAAGAQAAATQGSPDVDAPGADGLESEPKGLDAPPAEIDASALVDSTAAGDGSSPESESEPPA